MFSGILLALSARGGSAGGSRDPSRPNILFMMSDDHAMSAIGAYDGTPHGAPAEGYISTPHIDRIAKEGMRFDGAYVTNSLCGPSRASTLTGRFANLNGFYSNKFDTVLDESQWTFPKAFKKNGYFTGFVGKYHLGDQGPSGMDHSQILKGQGEYYKPIFIENGEKVQYNEYVTDLIANFTIETLDKKVPEGTPFMFMMNQKAPHRNWMAPPRHLGYFGDKKWPVPDNFLDNYHNRIAAGLADMQVRNLYLSDDLKLFLPEGMEEPGTGGQMTPGTQMPQKYNQSLYDWLNEEERAAWFDYYKPLSDAFFNRTLPTGDALALELFQIYMREYLQCVVSVDENVGKVFDYLESKDLLDNTLIVYTADQGFYLGEHGFFDKRFMYEESYRTPLLMRYPKLINPGRVSKQMVMTLDLGSTLLDFAGLGDDIDAGVQGESFLSILKEEEKKFTRDAIYYAYYDNPSAHNVKRHYGVRTSQYKLIHFYAPDINSWELYDLSTDPKEMNNIYDQDEYKKIQDSLHNRLNSIRTQYQDACPPLCANVSGPLLCPGGDVDVCKSWCPAGNLNVKDCSAECDNLCSDGIITV